MVQWEQLIDAVRDPSWQFVGAILALISVFIGIWIYRKQNFKSLDYSLLVRPLVRVDWKITGQIEILLNGKPIRSPSLLLLKIANSGKLAIRAGDYDKPLAAIVNGRIINVSVAETSPGEIEHHLKWRQQDNEIIFEKPLLNGGDWFEIQILASEIASRKPLILRGRIVGVKDIRLRSYQQKVSISQIVGSLVPAVAIGGAFFLPLIWAVTVLFPDRMPMNPIFVRGMLIGGSGVTVTAWLMGQLLALWNRVLAPYRPQSM